MFCPKCGQNVESGAKFCISCGYNLIKIKHNPLALTSLIIGIVSIAISFFAIFKAIAVAGLVVALFGLILNIILYIKKIKDSFINVNFVLTIVGLLSNFGWLAYLLWVLPTL